MVHMQSQSARAGFTLAELMVVVAIVAIMAVGGIGFYRNQSNRASRARTQSDLRQFQGAIESFQEDVGQLPRRLEDLINEPADAKNWGPYPYLKTKKIPKDGWGNEYVYKLTPGKKEPYELYSLWEKGKKATPEEYKSVWDLD